MSPEQLKQYIDVLRAGNVMQASLKFSLQTDNLVAPVELSLVLGPDPIPVDVLGDPQPGGWKRDPNDPEDPDPLGLGDLDAPFPADPAPEVEPE
jgi:hypothetical protein